MMNVSKAAKRKRQFQKPDFQIANNCIDTISEECIIEDDIKETSTLSSSTNKGQDEIFSSDFPIAMTKDEFNEHVQKCLEMSSENKITQKNAFALRLIDLMKCLLQKNDFSVFACTLEAGQKIYAHRVDSLHQQVVKLASEITNNYRDTNKNNKETNVTEKYEKMVQGKRKKKFIVPRETLKRKLRTKDPRDKFVKLDGVPGAIMNSVKRDPQNLAFTLENNIPFWPNQKCEPLRVDGTVTIPLVEISYNKSSSEETHDYFELSQTLKEIENGADRGQIMNLASANNGTDGFTNLVETTNDDDIYTDETCDNEETGRVTEQENNGKDLDIISMTVQRLNEEKGVNGKMFMGVTRLEAMKIIFDRKSDYHYLNMDYWAGPEHWKITKVRGSKEVKKNVRKKKIPREICYTDPLQEEKLKKYLKKTQPLTKRTIESWKKNAKKLVTGSDLKISVRVFLDLFGIPNMSESSDYENEMEEKLANTNDNEDNFEDNFNDPMETKNSQHLLNNCFYRRAPENFTSPDSDTLNSAFYDIGLINQRKTNDLSNLLLKNTDSSGEGEIIKVQFSTSEPPDTTMIPAPKIVQFKPIKYSSRPIQVNMHHLKEKMWQIINKELEKDCNSKGDDCYILPEIMFSNVLHKLPKHLEKTTAENLSPGMALVALLTLANEHSLHLENCDSGDIKIHHIGKT